MPSEFKLPIHEIPKTYLTIEELRLLDKFLDSIGFISYENADLIRLVKKISAFVKQNDMANEPR